MTVLIYLVLTAVVAYFLYREKVKKDRGAIEASVGTRPPAAPAKAASRLVVEESISVVLRRQIPVRFDESPRSWLGGLPMMPAHVPWPTASATDHPERGRTPLHFVAQVACADLPRELWGGLGPRTGWLLLFLKGPVDLVTVSNRPMTRDGIATITPENFASILYENAPVKERKGRIAVPEGPPFSWRGALYVVDSIARALSSTRWPEVRDADREKVNSAAWAEQTTSAIDERIAGDQKAMQQWDAREFAADDTKGVAQRDSAMSGLSARIANLTVARDFLREGGQPWDRMKVSLERFREWRAAGTPRVARLREQVLLHDLDTRLTPEEWETLRAALDNERITYWVVGYRDLSEGAPMRVETSLLTLGAKGLEAARVHIVTDYYVATAAKRSLVPPPLIEALEPFWRRLYDNRPHRMGGIHDPIQSDPRVGPVSEVLLFQIQSDDAMHWMWGDAGAYYVFIDTDRLANNDFTQLNAFFENH